MINRALFKQDPKAIIAGVKKKDPAFPIEKLIALEESVRTATVEIETLRKEKNELSAQAKQGVTPELREASIAVGKKLKAAEQTMEAETQEYTELLLSCPNIPLEDVPEGNKESNKVVKTYGEQPTFSFEVKHHLDLVTQNGWVDFEAAAKTTGSNFALYRKEGAKLLHALSWFMLKHNASQGYEVVSPPALVNDKTLTVSGNFPKFKDDVFSVPAEELFLIPTSEVALANMYRNEIVAGEELPIRMTSLTNCFRREAGNYGKMERGLIRMHQFDKVELFALTRPEDSTQELDRMVASAESILQKLGLHYRVSLLAAQDCSFQSAKTFDIEVWLPGQKSYYEVSSASNCTDFQARRGKIRYRDAQDEKPSLVHTLNASSLALPRLMVALIETYQQEDGTIALPDVLQKEMF